VKDAEKDVSKSRLLFSSSIIALAIVGFSVYYTLATWKKYSDLEKKYTETEEAYRNTQDSLLRAEKEKTDLINSLTAAGEKNRAFADEVDKITHKAETLERLVKTDPELLQKYSKVYFLNENYIPSELTQIDNKYLFIRDKTLQIHDRVWPFLKDMLDAANAAGNQLQVASAYRSFGTQAQLKSTYKVVYGAGTANSFSADQGYSEHQLGTTIDFTTPKVGGGLNGFEKSNAYAWLQENAYKYGFIVSYPQTNAYYIFEPWHWRFVGLDLALRLHNENKNFYDLEQRDINQYLLNIFNATTTSPTQ
jgi:LAS superfamily LD-carboxypeptidase LdcB